MTAAVADVPMTLRRMAQPDFGFVWETSMKVRKPHGTPWNVWHDEQSQRFRADMMAPSARVYVLEHDGVLVGFVHFIGGVLRMLYVKRDLRGFGYGRRLLEAEPLSVLFVHEPNPCWRRWAHVKGLKWTEVGRCR